MLTIVNHWRSDFMQDNAYQVLCVLVELRSVKRMVLCQMLIQVVGKVHPVILKIVIDVIKLQEQFVSIVKRFIIVFIVRKLR